MCRQKIWLIMTFSCIPNLIAQEDAKTLGEKQAKEAQKKLEEALRLYPQDNSLKNILEMIVASSKSN